MSFAQTDVRHIMADYAPVTPVLDLSSADAAALTAALCGV
jgi:hypothetical protein